MIVWNSEFEMPPCRQSSRIDIGELKAQIVRRLGHERAEKYFYHLNRFISLKLSKSEFDKLCFITIGRENLALHNQFIRSILNNACLAKAPPAKETETEEASTNVKIANEYQRNLHTLCGNAFPPSPRKGRSASSRDRKFRDRPSPLGPYKKLQGTVHDELNPTPRPAENAHTIQKPQEQQSATELLSIGSKALVSVEDGEEVEQVTDSPSVQSRSPVKAPLGIPSITASRKALRYGSPAVFNVHMSDAPKTCCSSSELPDFGSLKKRLEHKLEFDGLGVSVDCVNLLNNGLDAFLKRLIKPCVEIAGSRCGHEHIKQVNGKVVAGVNGLWQERYVQRSNQSSSASLLDFRVAMELNPQLLGEEWPVQLEKICLRALEE